MPGYARGRLAWGLCSRCGLRFYLRELVLDGYFPNIRVCSGCYDPPQPQERLAVVSDPEALWKPAPDAIWIAPPVLVATLTGGNVVLTWSGFNGDVSGDIYTGNYADGPLKSGGAQVTAGYIIYRSADLGVTWVQLANLANTPDDFGALSIETKTYTDVPGPGTFQYYVLGYDATFGAEYG
jgi:hypothetical protein